MKSKPVLALLLFGLIAFGGGFLLGQAPAGRAASSAFVLYKVESRPTADMEQLLNVDAKNGWRQTSVTYDSSFNQVVAILEKPAL